MKNDFHKSKLAKTIAWYSSFDFYVFPVHGIKDGRCTCGKPYAVDAESGMLMNRDGDCTNPGKHPVTMHGLKDAIHSALADQVAELFNYNTDYNVAIRTGAESGMFVVDVDGPEGTATLNALEETYGPLPPTLTFLTGKGKHIVFTHPGIKVKTAKDVWGSKIDCRGDGGYIVAPPSNHFSGRQYKIDDNNPHRISVAPAWLLTSMNREKIREQKPFDANATSGATPEWSQEEVWRMLTAIDPSCGYDDWLAVGMGLHDGGFSYGMWDQWSAGSFKYRAGCCLPHWRSFKRSGGISMGTLVDMAKQRGWHPETNYARESVTDFSKIQGFLNAASKPKVSVIETEETVFDDIPFDTMFGETKNLVLQKTENPIHKSPSPIAGSFGFDPLTLPGLIGDTVRWIEQHALFSQPELALLATLTFAGSVFGRRYASPIDTRTNLYMVGIARTGSGKDHPRKMINMLAISSGLTQYIGANAFRSDSGLARALSQNASQIMMVDEFGLVLQGLSDPHASPHIKGISRMLMELYSSSSSAYNHGTYADERIKPIVVVNPNLCLYGTTTETEYTTSMRKSAIESGSINRFVVAKSSVEYPAPNFSVPILNMKDAEDLTNKWKEYEAKSLGDHINSSTIRPKMTTIQWGACEKIQQDLLLEQCQRIQGHLGSLWVRLYENTIKIAMIFAIARNRINPIFYPEDFSYSAGIVRNAIRYMESLAADNMADSDTESYNLEVIKHVRTHGGRITREALMRTMRKLKKREFNDLLDSMIDSGVLVAEQVQREGGGRGRVEYVLQ